MLSYKMDFSSCGIVPGFGKSTESHIAKALGSKQSVSCIAKFLLNIYDQLRHLHNDYKLHVIFKSDSYPKQNTLAS